MSFTTVHAPGATLDYSIDFSNALTEFEGIVSMQTKATGITVLQTGITGKVATVFVQGGKEGTVARVDLTVLTNSMPPRTFVQSIVLKILSPPVAVRTR